VVVYPDPNGSEVGYCGLPDGGARGGRCPFCGEARHGSVCPNYTVAAPDGFQWSR
jgi:hypothetical protein